MVHATRDLVCLHATDPATVYLSAWARMTHPTIESVDRALYRDRNGNGGPTIWVNGRIVGAWAVRKSGDVVTRLLQDVGRAASLAVEAEAARLTAWLGAAPPVGRFPTPLAKELVR
jgi:hypothetical protein